MTGFNFFAEKNTDYLIVNLLEASKRWDEALSIPNNIGIKGPFKYRCVSSPPRWNAPEKIETASWNISENELLKQSPDTMCYKSINAGQCSDDVVITKVYDKHGNPIGFKGLPETGAKGPGILGKGMIESKPTPVTVAEDIIILTQDKKTGELYTLLGNRPEFCFSGGFSDAGEEEGEAAVREFFEEVLVGSYCLGNNIDRYLLEKDWKKILLKGKQDICEKLDVSKLYASEPGLAEFKFKVLRHKKPDAVKEIKEFLQKRASLSYAGFVKADPRVTNDRSVYTRGYSMTLQLNELTKVLSKYGLSMSAQSEEIGKLLKVKINKNILSKKGRKHGMYASHGPILIQALVHQIRLGNVLLSSRKVINQIEGIINCIDNETKKLNMYGNQITKISNKKNNF